ncbi:unnamed protein product [Hermetia illucens]|uniref:Uncharacterized protein n=1 Tax=Hermetia illucens TaxID=343691 RepID=A0A7R8YPB5_HERIL|nr:unnamed protein product [Hermetia illucens]
MVVTAAPTVTTTTITTLLTDQRDINTKIGRKEDGFAFVSVLKGIIHHELLPTDQTIDSTPLRKEIRINEPENGQVAKGTRKGALAWPPWKISGVDVLRNRGPGDIEAQRGRCVVLLTCRMQ